jgi:PAS domain S-box-containing protein
MRQVPRPRRPSPPARLLFGTTIVVGASVLGLVAAFLLRQESVIHRQYELRAEASANAIARESQFALLVGDAADLKRMAEVAVAGSEDVLYMVVEDASGAPIAAAHRAPLTARTVPGGAGGVKTSATRFLKIGPNSDIDCIEASVPAVAQPEGEIFSRRSDPQPALGRIRLGMSIQARRAMLVSSMRYAAAIGVLIILGACVVPYFQLRQKRVEAKFREAEERLSFLVSLSPAVLYSCDCRHQPRMTFVADNIRQVLGYDPEEFAEAEFFRSHLHPEDRPRAETMLEEMQHSDLHIGEYRFLHRDGKYRWMQDHRKIVPGASGRPAQLVGLLFDVTEKMEAAVALRKAHQDLRAVIDTSPLAIVALDLPGIVQNWNLAAERMFGWRGDEVLGRPLPDLSDGLPDDRLRRLKDGETLVFEGRRKQKDGRPLEVGVWAAPFHGADGAVTGILVEYADLSERKLLEAQLRQAQKLESIGQLAAGLAHEINTPIQYVGDNTRFLDEAFRELAGLFEAYEGVVGAASNGGVTPDLLDKVNQASEKADIVYLRAEIPKAIEQSLEGLARVAQIVRAMKEFSHPGPAELTAVDLNRAIESTILVCRNEWKYVAEMVTEFDAGLPLVPCLPGEMNQVILNLVVNAAQAISDVVKQRGGIGTIKVSTRRDGGWVEVRIQDTGAGIPAAIRTRVFDPFFTTKEVGKGTGQGLALAHSVVVQRHQGSITFETEEGLGTVFIIRLPLTEIDS